jgi:hypothetical protein
MLLGIPVPESRCLCWIFPVKEKAEADLVVSSAVSECVMVAVPSHWFSYSEEYEKFVVGSIQLVVS